MRSKIRGRCGVCLRTYSLRQDAMLYVHSHGAIERCPGSGLPPIEADALTWEQRARHAEAILKKIQRLPVYPGGVIRAADVAVLLPGTRFRGER